MQACSCIVILHHAIQIVMLFRGTHAITMLQSDCHAIQRYTCNYNATNPGLVTVVSPAVRARCQALTLKKPQV